MHALTQRQQKKAFASHLLRQSFDTHRSCIAEMARDPHSEQAAHKKVMGPNSGADKNTNSDYVFLLCRLSVTK
jgi:hypothetical protein